MNTADLIGRRIDDILVWSTMEVGGLDKAEVFIQLDNGIVTTIPWDFDSENIECQVHCNAISLFADLRDYPVYQINPKEKTIAEILNAKKKREFSLIGRMMRVLGIKEGVSREYRIHKTEYRENKLTYIQHQTIVDFLVFDDSDSAGFIELENGYIITKTTAVPHGTGMAGLNFYETLEAFKLSRGSDYKRMKNIL